MNKKIRKICSVFTVLCMLFNIMFTEISVMALELNTEDGISEQVENVKDQSNKENVDDQTEDAKKEKESGSKEDTGKETEEMPSLEFDESIDGIQVYASSDKGIFPKGTKMNLSLVSKKDVIKTANKIVDEEVVDAVAVDITFINSEGKEIEPTDPSGVHVKIKTSNKVKGSSHEVIHISDDGKAELVGDANSTSASFKSVGFSVYAIIGTDGYTEGDTARRTYIFYYEESPNNFVEWNRQIIKNGEELVEPGIPTSPYEDSYFTGWYNGKDHESHGSQAELTFGTINDIGQTEDETVEVHAHYSKEYAVIFWNRSKTDVIDTKEFNLENGTASVSLVGPTPQISGQEVHTGWIDVDTGEVYEPNASITITEERNIELKAKVEDAYKISFEGNGGTDEVTFTKPILVLPNEKGVKPADPERAGYNFTGWYKDVVVLKNLILMNQLQIT